jgi:hypothetical protein
VVESAPQVLVTLYLTVSNPDELPPKSAVVELVPTTVPFVLLAVQVPPATDAVRVMLEPIQTVLEPDTDPAEGSPLTVTLAIAETGPQLLVTV